MVEKKSIDFLNITYVSTSTHNTIFKLKQMYYTFIFLSSISAFLINDLNIEMIYIIIYPYDA